MYMYLQAQSKLLLQQRPCTRVLWHRSLQVLHALVPDLRSSDGWYTLRVTMQVVVTIMDHLNTELTILDGNDDTPS